VTVEARLLAGAIAGALDRIDLFEMDGGFVLLADSDLRPVGGEVLRKVLRDNFVTKRLHVAADDMVEKVYAPVEPSEAVIRQLLTAPAKEGGLQGLLPPVVMVQLRQVAEPGERPLPDDHPEVMQGRAVSARHAGGNQRLLEEQEGGRRTSARHAQATAGERPEGA
jgi:hypothetical protein